MSGADQDVRDQDGRDQVEPRITLIGKPGCHLCDAAREVVVAVAAETGTGWRELSILDDADLSERYREQIPVVLVDGEPHVYWRVDAERLRNARSGRGRWFGTVRSGRRAAGRGSAGEGATP